MPEDSRTPELLAPAGSPQALVAAVANGADAVYLGVESLNARRGAENFEIGSLSEHIRLAHLQGVLVYLTANVLVLEQEMADALRLVDEAWVAGVDAVIVQDIGFLSAIRSTMPDVRVHASTQIGAHNVKSLEALATTGVSRVTLARELSLPEIAVLADAASSAGVEIECFVHGALCVCYSGQCLLSSMIGGRSANRGLCAQPCRLPYEIAGASGEVIGSDGAHVLSPRDLAGISKLPELMATGVRSLKIEGRMKSAEYVALVTGTYRAAIDRVAADPDSFSVRDGEMSVLHEAFSRGFSTAYLAGIRGNDMMSYRRPNNRGVPVGRVIETRGRHATIAVDKQLDAEDTIEVWTRAGRVTQRAGALQVSGRDTTTAPAGSKARILTEAEVSRGDRVFRVANAALNDAARRTFVADALGMPVRFAARLVEGEPLRVVVTDEEGVSGSSAGDVVERARTKAVTAAEVMEHVGRLGGTVYEAAGFDIDMSPEAGIGFSQLHRVRREAITAYEQARLAQWGSRRQSEPDLPPLSRRARGNRPVPPRLVASTDDIRLARIALDAGADVVHVPTWALGSSFGDPRVVPVVPRILHDAEWDVAVAACKASPRVVAGNLGAVAALSAAGHEVEAHWSLNCLNPWTAAELHSLGATFSWVSPEATEPQVASIVRSSPASIGLGVWGRQELMVTEHCILMAEGECAGQCAGCQRRRSPRVLRDRKGYEFPVTTDLAGRSHLYNSVPLDLARSWDDVRRIGVDAVRLDITIEDPDEVGVQVRRWRAILDTGRDPSPPAVPTTAGHFRRGVR